MLKPERNSGVFDVARVPVTGQLAVVASHWWSVRWAVPAGETFRQQVLTDPICHLTFEDGAGSLHGYRMPAALVHGVVPAVFEIELPAHGRVTGLAFRPGGLAALLTQDAAMITGRVVPATELFGADLQELADAVFAEPDEASRRERVSQWLTDRILAGVSLDPAYKVVRRACALVDRGEYTRVDDLANTLHLSTRTLQRDFPRLVGVPPLWVIRRRRLQRVAERLDAGEGGDLTEVAAELGYADQAHLSRDFRAVLGQPPSTYRRG